MYNFGNWSKKGLKIRIFSHFGIFDQLPKLCTYFFISYSLSVSSKLSIEPIKMPKTPWGSKDNFWPETLNIIFKESLSISKLANKSRRRKYLHKGRRNLGLLFYGRRCCQLIWIGTSSSSIIVRPYSSFLSRLVWNASNCWLIEDCR